MRQGVNEIASRWARSARASTKEKSPAGEKLAALAKHHSSEAFYACEDPLEAALFSAFVGIARHREERRSGKEVPDVDP